jgi:hypothetical protein
VAVILCVVSWLRRRVPRAVSSINDGMLARATVKREASEAVVRSNAKVFMVDGREKHLTSIVRWLGVVVGARPRESLPVLR